jgi:hypothetical protein
MKRFIGSTFRKLILVVVYATTVALYGPLEIPNAQCVVMLRRLHVADVFVFSVFVQGLLVFWLNYGAAA